MTGAMPAEWTPHDGGERPSNAQLIAELQGAAIAIRMFGLEGLASGKVKIGRLAQPQENEDAAS